jgi:hypothetical protein
MVERERREREKRAEVANEIGVIHKLKVEAALKTGFSL